MAKKHKHSEPGLVKNESGSLTIGDYVMLRADGPLTREIMGSNVGLVTGFSASVLDGSLDSCQVLFCGKLFVVKQEHVQIRNY